MAKKVTHISIADATDGQLRWFAGRVLGLPIEEFAARDTVISAIRRAGHVTPTISITDATPIDFPPPADDQTVDQIAQPKPAKPSVAGEKITIVVERQEGPGGDRPIFVAVNGTAMLIPRGEPAAVAWPYVEALKNAVRTEYYQDPSTQEILSHEVLTHPFRIISGHLPQRAAA